MTTTTHKIVWASDLHLDHASASTRETLRQQMSVVTGDALVVSGDTSVAGRLISDLEFLADACGRPVYHVLGNHDHYGASVAKVRDAVLEISSRRPEIQWLPPAGVVTLSETTVLIGVDGWADGRHGDPLNTPLVLNDDRLIAEIAAQPSRAGKLAVKRALADADAARLATLLDRTLTIARKVIVATHLPPFVEALPTSGRLSHPDWLPLVLAGAVGEVLRQFAAAHPEMQVDVLCGHIHVATDVMIAPNLRCRVMGTRYGAPGVISLAI